MDEKITIDKAYYDFLVEKGKERCELYSENKYLRHLLKEKEEKPAPEMTLEDWKLYYDFVKHNWYPLTEEEREDELMLATIMMRRALDQHECMNTFHAMNVERDEK